MSEDNRKDCKWIEVFMNVYGDKVEKILCHLNPESRKVDLCKDCASCPKYVKNDEE